MRSSSHPRFRRRVRGAGHILTAAALAAAVYGLGLALSGIYPFGPNSILLSDMGNQYADFHAYYQQVLHGHAGLGFTWRADLGMNFLPVFAYYLASPFSLLVALAPERYLPEMLVLIITLKIAAGAGAMAELLRRVAPGPRLLAAAFAVPYAVSAWTVAYAFNIMWLDALYLLPLLLIAGEVLLARGRMLPLAAACAASALISYYMFGIMLPFVVLYLLARQTAQSPAPRRAEVLRFVARAAVATAVGVAVAGILLLPSYYGLAGGRTNVFGQDRPPVPVPWMSQAARMFGGSLDWDQESPSLAAGTVALLAASMFPFIARIGRAERLAFCGLAALLAAASQNEAVYLLWHDGERPNAWPFRYGFLFAALIVILGYRALAAIDAAQARSVLRRAALFWAVVLIAAAVLRPELLPPGAALAAAAALAVGAVLLGRVAAVSPASRNRAVRCVALLAVVVVVDAGVAAALESSRIPYPRRAVWSSRPTPDWTAAVKSTAPTAGRFYRADGIWPDFSNGMLRSQNESLRDGNYALNHFSSISSGRLHDALAALGFSENMYRIWAAHTGATVLTDALLGYQYFVVPGKPDGPAPRPGLQVVRTWPSAQVYQNTDTLPVGFLAPATVPVDLSDADPFRSQEEVFDLPGAFADQCRSLPDADGAVVDASSPDQITAHRADAATSFTLSWHCHAAGVRQIYAWARPAARGTLYPAAGLFTVQIDSSTPVAYPTVYDNGILDLGTRTDGDFTVTLTSRQPSLTLPLGFVRGLDLTRAAARIADLRRGGLHDVVATGSGLSGTVDAPTAGRVLLSVPAIRGWGQAAVDGRPTKTATVASAFLSVPVPAGHHVISLRFHPPGLRLGGAISGFGLLGLLALYRRDRRIAAARPTAGGDGSEMPAQRDMAASANFAAF